MSHFTVLVALRPTEAENIEAALKEALAPFDETREVTPYFQYEAGKAEEHWAVDACRENDLLPAEGELTWPQVAAAVNARYEHRTDDPDYLRIDADGRAYTTSTYNPQSKWDWWVIGGRWTGYFAVKPEHDGDPRLITGRPGTFGNRAEGGRVDGGPRGLLDFDRLRNTKAKEAGEQYDRWTRLVDGLPEALPWSHFHDRYQADRNGYPIQRARADYASQPRVQATRQSEEFTWLDCVIASFSVSRDEYMQQAADGAVPGFAYLGLDGVWQAPGEMGWFGMSSDAEADRVVYRRRMNELLDGLDPAVILVAVDCHI